MNEKDVLYFEEDDKSELGVNGKQVFFAKRINGKTEHNKKSKERKKEKEEETEKEQLKDNEIIIDLPYISRTTNKNSKKQTSNRISTTPKNKKNQSDTNRKKTKKTKKREEEKKGKKKEKENYKKNFKKQQKKRNKQIKEDKIKKKNKKNKANKKKTEETVISNDVMTIDLNNIREIEDLDNKKLNTKKNKEKNEERKQYNKNKEKNGQRRRYNKNKESNEKKQYDKNNEERLYKKKNRKKKRKTLKIFISLILLIIALIIFALVSPIFNIKKIVVCGNETVSTETIISLSGLQTGKNIFQNISSDTISKIKENTYIDDVTIKKILPETIEITVEEREVAYQVNVINSYVYLDYKGYILETSSEKADVPILSGLSTSQDTLLNGTRMESDDITKLNVILKIVNNAKEVEIYDLITEIIVEENEYILYLKGEKKYIYFGDGSNITNKMMYAEIILEDESGNEGYIMINGDLDDGFNPYFREESID